MKLVMLIIMLVLVILVLTVNVATSADDGPSTNAI